MKFSNQISKHCSRKTLLYFYNYISWSVSKKKISSAHEIYFKFWNSNVRNQVLPGFSWRISLKTILQSSLKMIKWNKVTISLSQIPWKYYTYCIFTFSCCFQSVAWFIEKLWKNFSKNKEKENHFLEKLIV